MPEIMRMWRGWIKTADRADYLAYLEHTGLADYRSSPGNLEATVLYRDEADGETEVVIWSRWESFEAIEAFAGDDGRQAVHYYRDDTYLLRTDDVISHFDVAARVAPSGE